VAGVVHTRGVQAAARRGALVLLALLAGCGGNRQSTLDPHSNQARQITHLWWGMLAAAVIVFLGTVALIALAWARRNREGLPGVGSNENRLNALVVVFGIAIPVAALATLFFISDIGVVRATDAPGPGQTKLTIQVVGRQWFWEVRYPGSAAVTANEIHIPAGTPVKVVLTTSDVIHSFWVPELNKKVDTIPGHPNSLELLARNPGVYRGQCAEFCGLQHAKMAMTVYADPPARYSAWLANMAKPLSPQQQSAGLQSFTSNQCASCHTLRGTAAQGRIGPDLTHLMSRKTLGALTIPNTPSNLRAWVVDPQQFKPGNKMPALGLQGPGLDQLISFLRSLN
jgi:cytochrome c oxidase subunit II